LPSKKDTPADPVIMARIAAPFGIKGWVKLQTYTEFADSLEEFSRWFLQTGKGWEEVEVEEFSVNAKGVVAKLKGCDTRNEAELLSKRDVAVPRDWLGETDEGAYLWIDLIGAEVINTLGDKLGRVETLLETGANDVLVVKSTEAEGGQRLIPFIDEVIVKVDRAAKMLTVNWGKDY
jgi:16S rRNA processing protein RimM